MKKKMSAEERAEFKGGKYMGGPAEERAEKRKKKTKRMMDGGSVITGDLGDNRFRQRPMPMDGAAVPVDRAAREAQRAARMAKRMAPNFGAGGTRPGMMPRPDMMTRPGFPIRGMRGGGLARKGVGMALSRGGLVKANGCVQRGKTKGKMV